MAISIRMPQLGESVAEGTVARWLKRPGDIVKRDEPVVEIITDKVNAELPSPVAGVLERVLVSEGETVAVGQEIAVVAETSTAGRPYDSPVAASSPSSGSALTGTSATSTTPQAGQPGQRFYTPVVLRMAAEHGIDLDAISGTGLGGRVTKKDVERYLIARQAGPGAEPLSAPPVQPGSPPAEESLREDLVAPVASASTSDEEVLPLTPMRRAIAENMLRSVQTTPHAWAMLEVDATPLVRWRESVMAEWQRREGFELTYLPFFIKAVVDALRENPRLNSSWDGDRIVLKKRIHIGVAVSLQDGLIVPVIHDADQMSIAGLARAAHDLIVRARDGRLTLQDVQGGTFTVNNAGALGSVLSRPIINPGQAAIITMEAITKRPVAQHDAIAIRSMMNICLSFDHRVMDGADALRFLQAVKRRVESFGPATPLY